MMPGVSMTADQFVTCIAEGGPELREVVEEHRRVYDAVLLHVLCGDLSRYCIAAWVRNDYSEVGHCLACAATALDLGDDALRNAIQASFVENVGPWDPQMQPFIVTWPNSLRAEAERQTAGE